MTAPCDANKLRFSRTFKEHEDKRDRSDSCDRSVWSRVRVFRKQCGQPEASCFCWFLFNEQLYGLFDISSLVTSRFCSSSNRGSLGSNPELLCPRDISSAASLVYFILFQRATVYLQRSGSVNCVVKLRQFSHFALVIASNSAALRPCGRQLEIICAFNATLGLNERHGFHL